MLKIALNRKPPFICIVPEKRQEITTEGGLNLNFKKNFLKKIINKLKKNKSRISLFVEPNLNDIKESKNLNADCIEIHTGKSSLECSKIVEDNNAIILGYDCLIDRSNGKTAIKEKIVSQVKIDIPTYTEKNLPKNLLTLKAVKPGSRNL